MDRKSFLSILGATPFAFKALMVGSPEKAKDDVVANPGIPRCLIKSSDGKELALLTDINISITTGGMYGQGRREWNVSFDNAEVIINDLEKLSIALETREKLDIETYHPESKELFFFGKGQITELNYSSVDNTTSGFIQGIDELVAPDYL